MRTKAMWATKIAIPTMAKASTMMLRAVQATLGAEELYPEVPDLSKTGQTPFDTLKDAAILRVTGVM